MSGIVGSYHNIRGSGVVAKLGTDGQLFTSAGAGVSQGFEAAAGGGGKVLQVIQATYSTDVTINSTTYTDSGVTADITCAATSSKVLVLCGMNLDLYVNSNSTRSYLHRLLRDDTELSNRAVYFATGASANGYVYGGIDGSLNYLDSPSSTSALTYHVEGKTDNSANAGSIRFQGQSGMSTIELIEIGA